MNKLKQLLGKSFKVVMFIVFTIIWSIFVYLIEGEWLYFFPLIIGDILFWETISWQFWKKKEKKKKKYLITIIVHQIILQAYTTILDALY